MSKGEPKLVRGLGLLEAITIIVGTVIGSGIFVAPSIMAGYIQSPGLMMGLWILGGALTLCGALAYAELSSAMPRAGGQYVFLSESFGPLSGFLFGWTYLVAINTGTIAAVAVAFAKYLGVFVPGIGEGTTLFQVGGYSFSSAQAVALVVVGFLTWLNTTGVKTGAAVQNLFTIAKFAAIVVLVVVALLVGKGSLANFRPVLSLDLGPAGVTLGLFAALAVAMSKALFAYDAWYTVAFASEEMKNPERDLVRSLIFGNLGVTLAYCAAVGVYLYMVPIGEMAAVKDGRIAAEAAQRIMGGAGLGFITIAILVSTFGCANGLILTGARVVYAMARDRLFFASAATIHPSYLTPANALLIQGGIAAALTLTGTYSDLLTMTAFSSLLFNTLTVAGLFVLRRTQPNLPRPYRAWGYPLLPALFVAVSSFFLVFILLGDPRNSGLGLILTAIGGPFYLRWRGRPAVA